MGTAVYHVTYIVSLPLLPTGLSAMGKEENVMACFPSMGNFLPLHTLQVHPGAHLKRCLPEEEDNCAGCFSLTGWTHSQNNLINNVLFSCVRVRNLSDLLDHCHSPGNGEERRQ